MRKSQSVLLMAIVVVIALTGGVLGGTLVSNSLSPTPATVLAENEYELGTAFLVGSPSHPAAHGMTVLKEELAENERTIKLQLEGVPELANINLHVFIDGFEIGTFTVDAEGNGTLTVRTQLDQPGPTIREGSLVEVKTPNTLPPGSLAVSGELVASGTF